MTHRDFCYWLQGYFEITGSGAVVTIGVWNTIVEHLALTVELVETESMGGFTRFVKNLWGFVQINGRQIPGDDQIEHIKKSVADLFEKVTSDSYERTNDARNPEERANDAANAERLLNLIRERRKERTDREQVRTNPWNEDTPICSAESPGQKLCNNDRNEAYCCSNIGFTPDGAWPSPAYDNFVADGQYPPQCNDKLGTDPLK